MMPIKYLIGDATQPVGAGAKIIAHCCNDVGAWGAGFVLAISKRWPEPEQSFRASEGIVPLGGVQYVEVEPQVFVANIIGQHGLGRDDFGNPPIRYPAISQGLERVANFARSLKASVHMPRMGCGLAGGEWAIIEAIIVETLCAVDVPVFVYDLPAKGGAS